LEFSNWLDTDAQFAFDYKQTKTLLAERLGETLIAKAFDGDMRALIFCCRTLGRTIGFDDRDTAVNINVDNRTPAIDIASLSKEERQQVAALPSPDEELER
jgi:hypothetical protein